MDGIDAVLCQIAPGQAFRAIAHSHQAFSSSLQKALLSLQTPGHNELDRAACLGNTLAGHYAEVIGKLLSDQCLTAADIRAIGCHGQTIRHLPGGHEGQAGYTLQIGNLALLAELTGMDVIGDFRSRDIAAGGQGAPLVPAFHAALFAAADEVRTVVNIGGMANLSYLHPEQPTRGFDCGPGNVLMDAWIQRHKNLPYDDQGAWAASALPDSALLASLLGHPYFALPPPKSCGREQFSVNWLEGKLERHGREVSPAAIQASLLALTAQSIISAIQQHCPDTSAVFVCGGGARNGQLLETLQGALGQIPVRTTADLGLPTDWVEAAAFAWLAERHLQRSPANLPEVTGAKGLRLLGCHYPA